MGAQIVPEEEEYAGSMGQRSVTKKDAQFEPLRGEYVLDMEGREHAASKDVQIKWSKEKCAESMGQRLKYAVEKDAPGKFKKEEYA